MGFAGGGLASEQNGWGRSQLLGTLVPLIANLSFHTAGGGYQMNLEF